jgi:hypothetical protein
MTDRYDVVTSRKDKDGKFRSTKIGAAFVKGDRINVVLDALPLGNSDGQAWLTLFPPKEREGQSISQRATPKGPAKRSIIPDDDMGGDSIPF